MKRTSGITLGVIMSALVAASGCGDQTRCVDANNFVVDEDNCKDDGPGGRTRMHGAHWYYGGYGHTKGTLASGGSSTPSFFSRVTRGGFGGSSSGHGFGG